MLRNFKLFTDRNPNPMEFNTLNLIKAQALCSKIKILWSNPAVGTIFIYFIFIYSTYLITSELGMRVKSIGNLEFRVFYKRTPMPSKSWQTGPVTVTDHGTIQITHNSQANLHWWKEQETLILRHQYFKRFVDDPFMRTDTLIFSQPRTRRLFGINGRRKWITRDRRVRCHSISLSLMIVNLSLKSLVTFKLKAHNIQKNKWKKKQ